MKTSIKLYIGIIFTILFLTSCQKENLEEIFNHQVSRDFYSTSEEVINGEQIRKSHVKVRGYDHKERIRPQGLSQTTLREDSYKYEVVRKQ